MNKKSPAIKFPMVVLDAKPTAAPPRAERATNHSAGNPPRRIKKAMTPIRMRSRNVKIKPFATFGAKRICLANLRRYLVMILSRSTAIITTIVIESMVESLMPRMVSWSR